MQAKAKIEIDKLAEDSKKLVEQLEWQKQKQELDKTKSDKSVHSHKRFSMTTSDVLWK